MCQFLFESKEKTLVRLKKTVWTKCFSHTHHWNPKLNDETFVGISVCRVKFTLRKALFYCFLSFSEKYLGFRFSL